MSAVSEVAKRLQDAGVGTVGTTIFRGELPESPVAAVAVRSSAVVEPGVMTFGPSQGGIAADVVRLEVAIRNSDRALAESKAFAVRAALDQFYGSLANPTGSPTPVEYLLIEADEPTEVTDATRPDAFKFKVKVRATKERSS